MHCQGLFMRYPIRLIQTPFGGWHIISRLCIKRVKTQNKQKDHWQKKFFHNSICKICWRLLAFTSISSFQFPVFKLYNHLTSSSGTSGWPMNIRHVVTIGINVNTPTNETIADACFATHLRIFSPPLFLWKHYSTKCIKQTKTLPKCKKQRLKFIFSFQTLFLYFSFCFIVVTEYMLCFS